VGRAGHIAQGCVCDRDWGRLNKAHDKDYLVAHDSSARVVSPPRLAGPVNTWTGSQISRHRLPIIYNTCATHIHTHAWIGKRFRFYLRSKLSISPQLEGKHALCCCDQQRSVSLQNFRTRNDSASYFIS
jgi:hypothetical protein